VTFQDFEDFLGFFLTILQKLDYLNLPTFSCKKINFSQLGFQI